jgi:hypothetical protein
MLGIFLSPIAFADSDGSNGEQRCDELGARCVCSEPLNTNSYQNAGGNDPQGYNPADSVSKECNGGFPVSSYINNVQPDNDPQAIAKMPGGNVSYFLGKPQSGTQVGTYWVRHLFENTPGFSYRRRSMRWYMYHSPGFQFCGGGNQNSKLYQSHSGHYWTYTVGGEVLAGHGWGNVSWLYGGNTPGGKAALHSQTTQTHQSNLAGNWVRYEMVVDNGDQSDGDGTRLRLYFKNVSRGDAEIKILDTLSTGAPGSDPLCVLCNNNDFPMAGATDLRRTDEAPAAKFVINNYAQGNGCNSWEGFSHIVVAAWSESDMANHDLFGTDRANEVDFRIGSAAEVEGVSGLIDPDVIRPKRNTNMQ